MPSEISRSETESILLLKALSDDDGATTDINFNIGNLSCTLQSWHYKNSDDINDLEPKQNDSVRIDYLDFAYLKGKDEFYRWQEIHAMVPRTLDNDRLHFTKRLFLSRCMWYFVSKENDGSERIVSDFIIVSLMRSRCVLNYVASVVIHIPSNKANLN